jgi:hypothetical protein
MTLPNGVYGSEVYVAAGAGPTSLLGHYAAVNGRSPSNFTNPGSISPNGAGTVGAGPGTVGSINALTLESDPDVNVNLWNCVPGSPGGGTTNNGHGGSHSVAADPAHNQIYVPIASTAWIPTNQPNVVVTGVCAGKLSNGAPAGGNDALGCIAVYAPAGNDP